jgi:ubiquinone/menaquinone biosynthesis C-methylase UbiE
MKREEPIKSFWDRRAREHKMDCTATLGEVALREIEINAISKYLKDGTTVLDVGCGNGYSTLRFAERHEIQISGIDFSEEMINFSEQSLKRSASTLKGSVSFSVQDVLSLDFPENSFDIVITERCLQNLSSWELQCKAIINISRVLKPSGLFLMNECSVTGVDVLVKTMNLFGKEAPQGIIPWHNLFFSDSQLINDPEIRKHLIFLQINNHSSLYMLITRLFPRLGRIRHILPNLGSFSYDKLYVWRKRT